MGYGNYPMTYYPSKYPARVGGYPGYGQGYYGTQDYQMDNYGRYGQYGNVGRNGYSYEQPGASAVSARMFYF